MKKNLIYKHVIFSGIIVFIAIVFIGLMINSAKSRTNDAIIDSTLSEMEQIGKQVERSLEETLCEGEENLSLLAQYAAQEDVSGTAAVRFFNMQAQAEAFDVLYYIDLEGNGISMDGNEQNFSDNESFQHAKQNDFHITEPHVSIESGEIVFGISVPVVNDGEVTGVLFGESSMDGFFEVLEENTSGTGDMFIVDDALNLVFSTSENHVDASDIPEFDVNEMGIENVQEALADILNGQSDSFYYDYFGTPKVMAYYPIEMTEWAMAMNADFSVMSGLLPVAIDYYNLVSSIVYWTIIMLVAYISFSQYRSNKKLINTAYYDEFTGLPNLARFQTLVSIALKKNPEMKFTMQKMDIAKFSVINDIYGRETGDKVILTIATIMKDITQNIEETFICARTGVDEFIMFAGNGYLDNDDSARNDSENAFKELIPELGNYEFVFRYGRYFAKKGESDVTDMISKTTLAHGLARQNSHKKTWDYDDAYKAQTIKDAEITSKMRTALENKEYKVFLQPKFSTSEDKLIGAEALVRWIEADGSMIFPGDFIPLFERNGFIVELDKYILENVCETIRRWMAEGKGRLTISVNCSRLNLANPFFVDGVVAIADKHGVPHELIEIELTESTTIANESTIEQLFADLRSNGFRISIDDFGAGYSSLGMLKNLHVDTLKMDRSFFVGGKNERRDDILIDSIVKMSHNLGMYVVAEGIETPEQVELLRTMNCDAIQGYVHAKPMPIDEFEEKYKDRLLKNLPGGKGEIAPILNINDTKFANTFAPCGLLISEIDECFTIVEANDYYFEMIGYTRDEVRDLFRNQGLTIISPSSRAGVVKYFSEQMQTNPYAPLEYTVKILTKFGKENTYHICGKLTISETGKQRLYMSLTDITHYVKIDLELQNEIEFNNYIVSQIPTGFFGYDTQSGNIRFSKNFAQKLGVPEIVEKFTESQLGKEMLPVLVDAINSGASKAEGEMCITMRGGEHVWYLYNLEKVYYERDDEYVVIGSINEAAGNKLEMDILKAKSAADPLTDVYNRHATERYIKNYLRTASPDIDSGALFAIHLNNFEMLSEQFGEKYCNERLKEIGRLLRSMFRSSDIIGRKDGDEFYVFINNYKAIDWLEKKAEELCDVLDVLHEQDGKDIHVTANVGISLYPEHAQEYTDLYEKALSALKVAKEESGYTLYGEVEKSES